MQEKTCNYAVLYFHAIPGDHNRFLHFFKNPVIAGGLLQIVAFGAGSLSLDGRRRSGGQRADA